MSTEYTLAGKFVLDASQTDAEIQKISDRINELKDIQKQFIEAFGEGAPEVAALGKEISKLESQISSSASAAQNLAAGIGEVTQPVSTLNDELTETKTNMEGVNDELSKGAPEVDKISQSISSLTTPLNDSAEAAQNLSEGMSSVDEPINVINAALTNTQKQLNDVNQRFGKGSPEADKLSQKIKLLETAAGKLAAPFRDFTKEIDSAQKELDSAVKTYGETSPEANKARDALKSLTDQYKRATTEAKDLKEEEKKLGDAFDETKKDVKKNSDAVKENAESAKKAEKSQSVFWGALKAFAGISVIQKGIDMFTDALSKNQTIADTMNTVMTTIENTLSAVVEVIVKVVKNVSESTNGFDALIKVLKAGITLSFTPLKLAIGQISLFIKGAQLAWEQSFFGDGDPETIKELRASIAETAESMKETAVAAWEAGKDIVTNLGEAVGEVTQVVEGVVEGVSKISVESIYENAKATTELKNNARLAAAQLQGVVEEYGMQAERLRQIRDDDRISISDRIAANTKLGEVLRKQQAAQLALVETNIAAAQADLNANKGSVELREKLIQAENERKAVLNQIAGFQSEQLQNEKALSAEALALMKAETQAETENYLTRKKNAADLIQDELLKNQTLQGIRNEERALEIQRLEENVNKYVQGTQARLDAEIELQNKKNELDAEDAAARLERENIVRQRENESAQARIQNSIAENAIQKTILDQETTSLLAKSERKLELLRKESELVIQQLMIQRDAEIREADLAGKSTVEIRERYKNAVQAVNLQLLQSEKDLAIAAMDERQKRVQDVMKDIEAAVGFFNSIIDVQLEKVQKNQNKDAAVQKDLLDSKKITQEQYERNMAKINEEAEKKKIKLQRKQILTDKAVGIANIIINTLQANAKANVQPGWPASIPIIIQNSIQGALAVGTTIAQASKALSALGAGGGDSSGGSIPGAPGAPVSPQTSGTTINTDQFREMVNSRAEPVRAYVVETDVRDNAERSDRLTRAATFG